ncbi:MAG: ATP-grasp domain-containing protein [Bacteroidia bacterium]|nr:ATP-grasp domain-containing protein [Bacteroidia bacterium]
MNTQIHKILIANRGEIASRIMRTCHRLGIETVAVFAEPDREASFVREADQAVALGGNTSAETYLRQDLLILAAQKTGAQAIHPGYGFLAENADFARAVREAGLIFIGPAAESMEAMGSKARAREIMQKRKVPVVPGYQGAAQDLPTLAGEAQKIGFPLLVKAAAGGGGKGMRVVREAKSLESAIEGVKREAKAAFGDDHLILERYFDTCRHIEMQVFGDMQGNVIHLGERECSLQRRHQKVVEEAPSPSISDDQRKLFAQYAVQAARAIQYYGAGTVEFLLTDAGEIYFLEMNTRLQVEHPVTEEITGQDLVEWQIKVAEGHELPAAQSEIFFGGHAIECRLYAEDPTHDFLPATGKILDFAFPEGENLRLETGIETGSEVGIWFDPMLAKIVTWAENRVEATRLMQYALRKMHCLGLKTNREFLLELISHPQFARADFHTRSLETGLAGELNQQASPNQRWQAALAATAALWLGREAKREILQSIPSGWRNNFYQYQKEEFLFGGEKLTVEYRLEGDFLQIRGCEAAQTLKLVDLHEGGLRLELDGLQADFAVENAGDQFFVQLPEGRELAFERLSRFPEVEKVAEKGACVAQMPGQVVKVLVRAGELVKAGDGMVILSSMKMENTLSAAGDGTVAEVLVGEGDFVEAGKMLIKLKGEE